MIRKGNVRNAEAGRCFGKQKKKWEKKKKREEKTKQNRQLFFWVFGVSYYSP